MTAETLIDTSPKIKQYDYGFPNGKTDPVARSGCCITEKYGYEPSSVVRTITTCGVIKMRTYIGGKYCDYWNLDKKDGYYRKIININSDEMELELVTDLIDVSYAYIAETGQILFAGKDSRYYGYRNISEVPEGSAS